MINMLYLVLLALLALNVSAEVLDAFRLVNQSLEDTRDNFEYQSQGLYDRFQGIYEEDPEDEVEKYWNLAQEVRQRSDSLVAQMERYKEDLVEQAGGRDETGHIVSADNLDISSWYMVEQGNAEELKDSIRNLREFYFESLEGILPEDHDFRLSLSAEDPDPRPDQPNLNWERQLFYYVPVTAAVTNLSRLQNDLRNSEADVVQRMLRYVAQDMRIQFDDTEAQVIPTSNYVMIGEEFEAEIFLAAFSRSQDPRIVIEGEEMDPEEIQRGKGIFRESPTQVGERTYTGFIELPGQDQRDSFEISYQAFEPAANITADEMNLMYVGLDNPITVSVPGYPSDRVDATITNGTLTPRGGDGQFNVTLPEGTRETTVAAYVTLDDGSRERMGEQEYRVRNVPRPTASLQGNTEGEISRGEARTFQFLTVRQGEGFAYDLDYNVQRYRFMYEPERGDPFQTTVQGRELTQQIQNILSDVSSGDMLIFTEIDVEGPEGTSRANGITLTIQ